MTDKTRERIIERYKKKSVSWLRKKISAKDNYERDGKDRRRDERI